MELSHVHNACLGGVKTLHMCFDNKRVYTTPAREKLQPCESFPTSSVCCRGCRRFDPEQHDPQAPSLTSSLPWKYTYSQMQYDLSPTHINQHSTVQPLTRSTQLPSSVPSWPPLGNLQAQLHSSRYFCLWHGTRSQSYTELAPDPPNRICMTCRRWRLMSSESAHTLQNISL